MDSIVRPAIEEYCTAHSAAPSALLAEVHAYTIRNCASAQMLIGPLEAAFLQLLVRATGTRRILEIGTFTGYSALAMAEALPPDGELTTCDIDPQHADIAQRFFARSPHGRKITLRLGPALDTLRRLPADPPYDLVFIDADKENYLDYYEQALPLVKTGGLIVADNVLWYGRVLHPEEASDDVQGRTNVGRSQHPASRDTGTSLYGAGDKMSEATRAIVKFNAHVRNDARVECVMLPLRDGVSLIRKR